MASKRIIGYDIARALAVFGMVVVNFKIVIGEKLGSGWLKTAASLLEGKAAATFVFLAGIGVGLMARKAVEQNDSAKLRAVRVSLLKRSIFLFVVGLLYMPLWPADILHYYGIYMLLGLLLVSARDGVLWTVGLGLIFAFVPMLFLLNYEQGWDFTTLEYTDFWTPEGFLRNLFYNGFHPVVPWAAFLVLGMLSPWRKLGDAALRKKVFLGALGVFILVQMLAWGGYYTLVSDPSISADDAWAVCGTSPMPPMPLYMLSGTSFALMVVCIGVQIGERWPDALIVRVLVRTGQLALTLYVAHVLIGMWPILLVNEGKVGQYSIDFTIIYSIVFCLLSSVFAYFWRAKFDRGPLEWLMRKLVS